MTVSDDDDLDTGTRRPRGSLDAQRYNINPKPPIAPTPVPTTGTTFLLPILLPVSNSTTLSNVTQPISLTDRSAQNDARPPAPSSAVFPQEIASADLAIACLSFL